MILILIIRGTFTSGNKNNFTYFYPYYKYLSLRYIQELNKVLIRQQKSNLYCIFYGTFHKRVRPVFFVSENFMGIFPWGSGNTSIHGYPTPGTENKFNRDENVKPMYFKVAMPH